MKCELVFGMGVVLLVAGCGREKLEQTQRQLALASNEIAEVKSEMTAKVDDLQKTLAQLTEEKAKTEEKVSTLKSDMEAAQQDFSTKLQQQDAKVSTLEQEKADLSNELKTVSDRLTAVNQRLDELQKTHGTTVSHLQAMREEFVKLTNEKAVLEGRMHDLSALKEQMDLVKREMHEKKVEEIKRIERAETAMGNGGYVMKQGAWAVAREPGNYPLTEDLRR